MRSLPLTSQNVVVGLEIALTNLFIGELFGLTAVHAKRGRFGALRWLTLVAVAGLTLDTSGAFLNHLRSHDSLNVASAAIVMVLRLLPLAPLTVKSRWLPIVAGALACVGAGLGGDAFARATSEQTVLTPCHVANVAIEIRCGTFLVYEDRARGAGRRIPLLIRVVPAATEHPAPEPLVVVSPGGPGLTNSELVALGVARAWREDRDVVFVDLRGTSGPSRLDCPPSGSVEHPGGYLDGLFDIDRIDRCRRELESKADLRFYTTRAVVDDLHDVLTSLGYARVNLWGASGGTREVLEFIRRHPTSVRSAIVEGVVPVTFKNPLPHAKAAQVALDSLFAQCARDGACASAFPRLRDEFYAVLDSLSVRARHVAMPVDMGGVDSTVVITRDAFTEGVRLLSYNAQTERSLPFVVHRAATGDYAPFISAAITRNRQTRTAIRLGFLLSQTCTEDVPRITDVEVARETNNTYLGDHRVRDQQAACAHWTRGTVATSDFTPVRSNVPVFLLSGTIDPVAPSAFAADAARYLASSIRVIAPGGHVPNGPCIDAMERQFLAHARPSDVDTSCVEQMTLPAFKTR
jgi:pimeloyl-ACP methyl ester carboxylesterase